MLNQREDPDPEEIITDPDAGVQNVTVRYVFDGPVSGSPEH